MSELVEQWRKREREAESEEPPAAPAGNEEESGKVKGRNEREREGGRWWDGGEWSTPFEIMQAASALNTYSALAFPSPTFLSSGLRPFPCREGIVFPPSRLRERRSSSHQATQAGNGGTEAGRQSDRPLYNTAFSITRRNFSSYYTMATAAGAAAAEQQQQQHASIKVTRYTAGNNQNLILSPSSPDV
ncbi:unnamed protein product [Calypogeia fissa]